DPRVHPVEPQDHEPRDGVRVGRATPRPLARGARDALGRRPEVEEHRDRGEGEPEEAPEDVAHESLAPEGGTGGRRTGGERTPRRRIPRDRRSPVRAWADALMG